MSDLFEALTPECKLSIANLISQSDDPLTSSFGTHAVAALQAASLTEAVPHLQALKEFLPDLYGPRMESIVNYPYYDFIESLSPNEPSFTKRLCFSPGKTFVFDSTMVGVHRARTTSAKSGAIETHLLAYDISSEKLIWALPLIEEINTSPPATDLTFGKPRTAPVNFKLRKVGDHLHLHFEGEKSLYIIEPATGKMHATLELPPMWSQYEPLHITPEGFGYQILNKSEPTLIGGKIIDNHWITTFSVDNLSGEFCPLSTHVGFKEDDSLTLFGPAGDAVIIANCLEAKAHGDKLYTIEKDLDQNDKCLLRIRSLKLDAEVVSGVESTIPLNVIRVVFGDFTENHQLILFDEKLHTSSPIFINLASKVVSYSSHVFSTTYTKYYTNIHTGELWTWNYESSEIHKVSSTDISLMGNLKNPRSLSIVHVDDKDQLYFKDRSY